MRAGHAPGHAPKMAWPFLVIVGAIALMFARYGLPSFDPVILTLLALAFILSLAAAGGLGAEAKRRWRRDRDWRLRTVALSRVPLIVQQRRERVDRALGEAISALEDGEAASRVLAGLEGIWGLLPGRAGVRYRMAAARLREAAGQEEGLEMELDLLEAEKGLWAARAEFLRGGPSIDYK